MKVNKYENIQDFWKDTETLLEKEEWYNCLMIGNCLEALEKGSIEMFLAAVTNEYNVIELIMLYRKPWKIIFYSPTNNYSDEILKFTAEEVCKYDKELQGNTNKIYTKFYERCFK